MAKPAHTRNITITRRTERRPVSQDKDSERFRLRRDIDQRLADMQLERSLQKVWQL